MQPITHDSIRDMAADLAGHLLPVLLARAGDAPELSPDALAGPLTPGVAVFTGMLMILVPDHEDTFEASLGRFLANPATAEALNRYQLGDFTAQADLFYGLRDAGVQANAALGSYLPAALDALWIATAAALRRAVDGDDGDSAAAGTLLSLLTADGFIPTDYYDLAGFVERYHALGLGRVERYQALAADGVTVIYTWEPPAMAGPPEDAAEYASPETYEAIGGEDFLEAIGETGGSDEPKMNHGSTPQPPPQVPEPESPTVDLRLDAALPDRVTVGRAFDLAAAIRRPTSPVTAPDDLGRTESADFTATWPAATPYLQFQIQISAPECDIQGEDSQAVRLYDGKDSPLVYFQLKPRAAGPLSVIITVYQELDWIGSTRLKTEAALMEPRGGLNVTVESRPVGNGEVNLVTLRAALDDGYNDSELRDVCFELGVDYEDLPGDNQSAKARELVLYAKRRNRTADLVRLIMRDRPHLLA